MRALRRAALPGYTCLLFTATHWPNLRIEGGPVPRPDLFIHLGAFGTLALLAVFSTFFGDWRSPKTALKVFAGCAVYAAFDELSQGIPILGRTVALDDYLANLLGIVLACAAAFALAAVTKPREPRDDLGSGVRTFAGFTLFSRVLGLARDLVTVRVFGDTLVGSAFAAAFAVPNVFRRLFGEGALAAAFIPEYASLDRDDPERARAFASLTAAALTLITGALTVVIELALLLVLLLAPEDADRALSLRLVMLLLPFMPMVCLAATLGGVLQTHGRFAPTAAMPVVLNICLIAAAVPFLLRDEPAPEPAAFALAGAALLAGALQVAVALFALADLGPWRRPARARHDGLRTPIVRTLRRFGPAALALGTIQLSALIDTLIAMYPIWIGPELLGRRYPLDETANAVLFYAQRLYQFPLGVFGIAVATVVFPALARHAATASDTAGAFAATLRKGLRLSLFIGIPATAGLLLVAEPIVALLFGAPEGSALGFSAEGVERATAVLLCYALAIWAYGLNQLLTRAFFARGDTRTPLRVAVGALIINLVLNVVLIWSMREAGLALATALSAIAQTLALSLLLARSTGWSPWTAGVLGSAGRTAMGAAACVAAVLAADLLLPEADAAVGLRAGFRLAALIAAGGGAFLLTAVVARQPELRELISRPRSGTRAD